MTLSDFFTSLKIKPYPQEIIDRAGCIWKREVGEFTYSPNRDASTGIPFSSGIKLRYAGCSYEKIKEHWGPVREVK